MSQLIKIGFTKKSQGKEGLIRISVDESYLDSLSKARAIFIDLSGSKVPFLIEQIHLQNNLTILLDEIDNPQSAAELSGRDIFLEKSELQDSIKEGEVHLFSSYIGFEIQNEQSNKVGQIVEIEEFPLQFIAKVVSGNNSFHIPMHENLILAVKKENRIIQMRLPQGLDQLS